MARLHHGGGGREPTAAAGSQTEQWQQFHSDRWSSAAPCHHRQAIYSCHAASASAAHARTAGAPAASPRLPPAAAPATALAAGRAGWCCLRSPECSQSGAAGAPPRPAQGMEEPGRGWGRAMHPSASAACAYGSATGAMHASMPSPCSSRAAATAVSPADWCPQRHGDQPAPRRPRPVLRRGGRQSLRAGPRLGYPLHTTTCRQHMPPLPPQPLPRLWPGCGACPCRQGPAGEAARVNKGPAAVGRHRQRLGGRAALCRQCRQAGPCGPPTFSSSPSSWCCLPAACRHRQQPAPNGGLLGACAQV